MNLFTKQRDSQTQKTNMVTKEETGGKWGENTLGLRD